MNKLSIINQKVKTLFSKRTIACSIFLSILFHLSILITHYEAFEKSVVERKKEKKTIKIVLSDPEELKKKKEKSSEAKKNISKKKKQIVNSEAKGRIETPKDTRFLGKQDQVYDRQTIARKVESFKEAGKGEKDGVNTDSAESKVKVAEETKMAKTTNKVGTKKAISLDDLMVGEHTDVSVAKKSQKNEPLQKKKGLKNGNENLKGLASNNDFIEDVPLGDMTNLNTVEYKYFGFYDRIRKKLELFWGDTLRKKAENLYRGGGRIPASDALITSLKVILDYKGNIIDVKVKGTSGIRALDEAAIESFNKAGPFPNPPKGMLKSGRATIEWGFVVKG